MDFKNPTAVFSAALTVCFLAIFLAIVFMMLTKTIDLSDMLSEPGIAGKASLSRFQLLVFTLVIAGLYVILSIENGQLVDIPNGALALLGISGGTFVISKSIPTKPDATESKTVVVSQTETSTSDPQQ